MWPESVPNLRNEIAKTALPVAAVAAESKAEGAGVMPLNIVMIVRPATTLVLYALSFEAVVLGHKGGENKVVHCYSKVSMIKTILVLRRLWEHRATSRYTAQHIIC